MRTIRAIAGVRCLYAHASNLNTKSYLSTTRRAVLCRSSVNATVFNSTITCFPFYYCNNLASKFYSSRPDSLRERSKEMEEIEHRIINANGINMHVAEKGKGPVILFLHGFPELWYSWRHQITAFASLGYRAVAPDLRGYGDTDAPPDAASGYTSLNVVGDLIALLDVVAPEQDKVFVVGHDWGALIAWWLCLFRPDRVKALVNMSVVFSPRNPNRKPLESLRAFYGDDYYICRFQEPGVIEAEFSELGCERVLKGFLTYRNPGPLFLPKGKYFGQPNSPISLPSWLSEKDFKYYICQYEKKGFTGGLNYYRNLDLNWELTAPWTGSQVKVPVKFMVGDQDLTYNAPGTKDYIHKGDLKRDVPFLEEVVVMEGAAHFLHEEKPDEINKHIYDFFQKF